VGKTTLARQLAAGSGRPTTFFDLENPDDLARVADPILALKGLHGLVVIDEVQRRPELFPILRVLADRSRKPARFLLLGSAAPELLRQSAESLAGRIVYHELGSFSLEEVGMARRQRLWLRGGLPQSSASSTARRFSGTALGEGMALYELLHAPPPFFFQVLVKFELGRAHLAGFEEVPPRIIDTIPCQPDTPRYCPMAKPTLSEIRAKVEQHIKQSYLGSVNSPLVSNRRLNFRAASVSERIARALPYSLGF
jgi:hypothetical protein